MRSASLVANLDGLMGLGETYGDARIWTFSAPAGTDAQGLRDLVNKAMDRVRHEIPSVVVGATTADGKVSLIVSTNDKARAAGLSASTVLKQALPLVGGRGGGKDDVAQGGGTDPAGLEAAFAAARESVRTAVGA